MAKRFTSIPYVVGFLVFTQVALGIAAPISLAYRHRMDYDLIKDNLSNVGATLDLLAKHIRDNNLTEYVILLGDSLMYSSPGGAEQSVSRFMEDIARENGFPTVFNLGIPAAQMGDFYTLLLMLDERGISTDYVVMNLIYAGFVDRDPDPPIVYWLERDLRRLDRQALHEISADLNRSRENKDRPSSLESFLQSEVYSRIPVLKYRDFIRTEIMKAIGANPGSTGDPRPWFEKPYLRDRLAGPVYERQFDPSPLTLDNSNPNVAFLKRIVEHQKGKRLFMYMSPFNKQLTSKDASSPGFAQNMEALDRFLEKMAQDREFRYANLTSAVPSHLFSDHMHLVSDGYRFFADILWRNIRDWFL